MERTAAKYGVMPACTTRLSVAEWLAILNNPKLTRDLDLSILNIIYHSPEHQNRAGWIGTRLGYQKNPHGIINMRVGEYVKRIAAARAEPLRFELRANGKPYWWTLLFNGWYQAGTSYFIWQIKPELCQALEQSALLTVPETDTLPEAIPAAEERQLYEGAKKSITVNAYERNAKARQQCLAHYQSYDCQICGFNFERAYGELGRGRIDVHHIVPLANIAQSYRVNPTTDLLPVCPNCHAMLHRRNPPLSVDELKALLAEQGRLSQEANHAPQADG